MAQHVITIVVTADDPDFSSAVEDAVNALQSDGYTPTEVRVASDQGEAVMPVTVETEEPPSEEPPPEVQHLPTAEEETTNA
jgi:hypothetical protein